ncbi:Beta-D-xylosidase [Quillaja saponaria]|uniref:Beta-D-xylosidase n=1 Tax=Quillaja saponaria TaxID=32244 RepID=A0AAD7PKJ8_QUISA|nr:Beta-D-xylosidase [Quillaja saponaria]
MEKMHGTRTCRQGFFCCILCSTIYIFIASILHFIPSIKKKKLFHRMIDFSFMTFTLLFFTHLLVHAELTQPPLFACDSSNSLTKSYPFCRTKLSTSQRVNDLVSRLTLDEKISQLVDSTPPIPRLGIPGYEWWNEALHGVAYTGRDSRFNGIITSATSFPQVILTAASFDSNLWYRIGQAIGAEARAMYNAGQSSGMTFWAPNINIFRDPRWGRGQETPGEDPLLTGKYAVAFVRGIQGDSFEGGKLNGRLQTSACCKHLTAYDLDKWKGVNRFVFNARVSLQDLADTYQPPFQSCVQEGKASGIMCAYNRVNGVPSCANYDLLSKTARGQWKFNGYITADCDAVSIIHDEQGYAKLPEDAIADVLNAGMDVDCGTYLLNYTKSAVTQKKVPVSQIDRALRNLFSVRMRLGLFDGNPAKLRFGNIVTNQICSKEHQDLALEAARDGIVLLKNNGKLLPLPKSNTHLSLAVIGPSANSSYTLRGDYFGPPCKNFTTLQALQGYVKNIIYHQGCDHFAKCPTASIKEAVEIAKKVDYVVLIMGLDLAQEREELDRIHINLPGKQQELIKSVAEASKKPIILVILSGGPVDISSAKDDNKVGSILWAGYPGEAGGIAIAEIIFGDHNPGGRLPITWYPSDFVRVPMTDMRMRPDPSSGYPGRTYRFYTGRKVFEFGYGLSYSRYAYEFISVTQNKLYLNQSSTYHKVEDLDTIRYKMVSELGTEFCQKISTSVTVGVRNDGDMVGKHLVLLFVRPKEHRKGNPLKQLVGFQSLKLDGGERTDVKFAVSPCEHLSRANEAGLKVIEEGSHFLLVGDEEYQIDIIV